MSKRRYQHVQELLPRVKELVKDGKPQREIAELLGLASKETVKKLLEREKKKELQGLPKSRGRKPAKTLAAYCSCPDYGGRYVAFPSGLYNVSSRFTFSSLKFDIGEIKQIQKPRQVLHFAFLLSQKGRESVITFSSGSNFISFPG